MSRASDKPSRPASTAKSSGPAERPAQDDTIAARQIAVLIVDDDAQDRLATRRALGKTKLNCVVTEAMDVAAGLQAVKKQPYDVVLLDHLLPDGKSRDFLRQMADLKIRVPVVVTTGYGDEMLAADLLKSEAMDYLPKDKLSPESLSRAIAHVIHAHRTREEALRRETLLQAGAEAGALLYQQGERFSFVSGALAILGRASGADQLVIYEMGMHPTAKEPCISHRFEWIRDIEDLEFNDPSLQNVTFNSLGIGRWHAVIASGHTISGAIASFPPEERKSFEAAGIRWLLLVPIMLDGRCWGFVQIADRRSEHTWSEREKNILLTIATGFGTTLMHRRADDALRQSEERYRAIVETQADLVCRSLPDTTLTYANDAYCRFFGKKREELIGRSLLLLLAEEDRTRVLEHFKSLSPKAPGWTMDHRVMGPRGETCWLRWSDRAIFDKNGATVEVQSVGHDITEQRLAEEALRESESRYRALFENIPAIAYTADLDETSTTMFIGPQVREILGYDPEDYRINLDLWVNSLHPDDRERVLKEVAESRRTGQPFLSEYRTLAKDGHVVWFHDRASFVRDSRGKPVQMQGVMYDISDRRNAEQALKESESRHRDLIESLELGVFRSSGELGGCFLQANTAHLRMLGYDSWEELRRVPIKDLYYDPGERARLLEDLRKKGSVRDRRHQMRRKDGAVIWLSLNAKATFDEKGQIKWIEGFDEDVTERKRTEDALSAMEELYRSTVDSINDPMMVIDSDLRVVLCNSAFREMQRLAGIDTGNPAGKTREEVFPFLPPASLERSRLVFETGAKMETEETYAVDGREYITEIKRIPVLENKRVVRVIIVIRDITDRKRAEEALRRSEEGWRAQYKGFPIPTYTWRKVGDDFILTDFNDAAEQVTKGGVRAYRGQPASVLHKDKPEVIAAIGRCFNERTTFCMEMDYRYVTTGEVRRLNVTFVHVPPDQVMIHADDVTERKCAEDALRDSERHFREFAEMMPQTVFEMNETGQITFVNQTALGLWGFAADNVQKGVSGFDLVAPGDIARLRENIQKRYAGNKEPHEYMALRKDGTTFPALMYSTPIIRNGRPAGLRGIVVDITERKKAEQALRESEERYRTLTEASPDMVYLLSPEDGKILYVNSFGATQFHARPEEVIGHCQDEMFPPEIARRHRANVDLVCRTGDTLTTEVPEFLQESKRWIDTRLVPIKDASGRVTAVLGISRDVTRQRDIENALRESEANFRALAENALDGILICSGPDASCVYANESIAAMCGYSIHEFLQTPLQAIIPSEEVAVILDRYRRRVKGEVLPGRYEDRFRRKDGQIFPVELSLTRTIWQGQPATLAVARDISALKRSEEERRRLAANLLEVQEKERAQISFMLHDHLGQLLTLSRLELGSIRTQDEASKVSVDKALARLDDALHAVRRLAVSLRPPILDDLGIEVAIETLVEEFGESVNIQTAFRRNGPPPQLTKDQETSLYRVLQEALTNSAKHSDAGHIEVTLTTSLKSVTLEIRDDGKGFDMEKMHEHSGERGIGFIGMRERLARCGGELEMVSGEGKGTTILARIPAKGAPDKGSLE